MSESSDFSTSSPKLAIVSLIITATTVGEQCYLICTGVFCIPVTNGVEYLFMHLGDTPVSSLEKSLFQSCTQVLTKLFVLLLR